MYACIYTFSANPLNSFFYTRVDLKYCVVVIFVEQLFTSNAVIHVDDYCSRYEYIIIFNIKLK